MSPNLYVACKKGTYQDVLGELGNFLGGGIGGFINGAFNGLFGSFGIWITIILIIILMVGIIYAISRFLPKKESTHV